MAGLSVVGRDHYGVFPLRGKMLNVREASSKQIMDNEEIQNIKKILGLQQNKEYTSVKSLRYGHLMIMADQVRVNSLVTNYSICSISVEYYDEARASVHALSMFSIFSEFFLFLIHRANNRFYVIICNLGS